MKHGGGAVDTKKNKKVNQYNRWGYIFLIPFISVYIVFQFTMSEII